ncbi:MAG: radical SAM protein [Candidatus Paceibacterota bacterium]|jgi:hypothetical protein
MSGRIGLIDVDGHNFPNIAMMKISAWHKSQGDHVEFANICERYDMVYKSKVFTFSPDDETCMNTDKTIIGGTGYNVKSKLPEQIDSMFPDYTLYNCDHAYGFLTRGCIRKCPWCIVPEKEGKIRPDSTIEKICGDNYKSAILMDNNVLASDHGIKQIEEIIKLKIKVDFNQGLDARLIDNSISKLLSKVKWLHAIRLACDSPEMMEPVRKAVELLRWNNVKPQRFFVYTMINNIPESIERLKFIKGLYCEPFAQPYRDFKKNTEPTREQKDLARWVNQTAIFNSVPLEEYR